MAEHHLTVEHPHPDQTKVTILTCYVLQFCRQIDIGHPLADDLQSPAIDPVHLVGRIVRVPAHQLGRCVLQPWPPPPWVVVVAMVVVVVVVGVVVSSATVLHCGVVVVVMGQETTPITR